MFDDIDRHLRRRFRLSLDRLENSAVLPTGEDLLDAGHGRILTRQRDRVEFRVLEHRDDRAREGVVGGKDALDRVVVVIGEHLLEDRQGRQRIPVGPLVAIDRLLEPAAIVERVEDRVVALLKQYRVVIGDGTVQLGDDRHLQILAVLL